MPNFHNHVCSDSSILRRKIIKSLEQQGFSIRSGAIFLPDEATKDTLKDIHKTAVEQRIARARSGLYRKENKLIGHLASGSEVDPNKITPRLVEVHPRTNEELLFRYASIHWSIPVSSGYGKRLRFIVLDESNNKLMGIIGLGDPVYNLGPRDEWIGWSESDRELRLRNVMDAFVLGSVPPYSFLLCGKLIAMLVASDTVQESFRRKYMGSKSLISGITHDGNLALITTSSAFGRSSVYNRLSFNGSRLYTSVGFTKGTGEFHFSNGLFETIVNHTNKHCEPTYRKEQWGSGFRNRREILKKCLSSIGLSHNWLHHGIKREVFVVPLARNTKQFLRGEDTTLVMNSPTEAELFSFFKERWLLPRLSWDARFASWEKHEWAIWSKNNVTHV